LFHLTGVWNWAIRKIEHDAYDGISYTRTTFHNLLADHGTKLGIPSHTLQGMLDTAYTAWQRCFKRLAKKPRLKGQRNKLTSIPFPDPFKAPDGTRIHIPGLRHMRFHAQGIPAGRIKSGRMVKRASGWYLCLFIDAPPQAIPHTCHTHGCWGFIQDSHSRSMTVVAWLLRWPQCTPPLEHPLSVFRPPRPLLLQLS
jgi:putative transposase